MWRNSSMKITKKIEPRAKIKVVVGSNFRGSAAENYTDFINFRGSMKYQELKVPQTKKREISSILV